MMNRPEKRSQPGIKGIEERERRKNGGRQDVSGNDRDTHHNAYRKHSHSLRSSTRQQKQSRCHLMQGTAEALIDQLIRGQHLALKILRQEDQRHHNPSQHVADDDLQKSEVSRERHARNANNRQRTGLRRDDRQRNRPPRNRLVSKKEAPQRPRIRISAAPKTQTKQRDAEQVDNDQRQIDRMKTRWKCCSNHSSQCIATTTSHAGQTHEPAPRSKPQADGPDISCLVMSLFLAIDAGGTKTRCLLADESQVLGPATTGSVKLMRVGEAEASARLRALVTEGSPAA